MAFCFSFDSAQDQKQIGTDMGITNVNENFVNYSFYDKLFNVIDSYKIKLWNKLSKQKYLPV